MNLAINFTVEEMNMVAANLKENRVATIQAIGAALIYADEYTKKVGNELLDRLGWMRDEEFCEIMWEDAAEEE